MGLFSGLEKFGLGKLEKMDVFEEEKKRDAVEHPKKDQKPQIQEEDLLFDKSFTCPVCDEEFHSKMVRTGKVKLLSADSDLRPKYQMVDSLKYDALVCPHCGYAALSRFFKFMLPAQAKMIRENITANFKGIDTSASTYSYDDAIMRHQLALANAVVKNAKTSEKAYTCLKMAWLYRGKAENLPKDSKDYQTQIIELKKQELELLKNACEGFKSAYSKETFPMCGMDEITMMYLIADLCRRIGHLTDQNGGFPVYLQAAARMSALRTRREILKIWLKRMWNACPK